MEYAKGGILNEEIRWRTQDVSSSQSEVLVTKNRGRSKNKGQGKNGRGKSRSISNRGTRILNVNIVVKWDISRNIAINRKGRRMTMTKMIVLPPPLQMNFLLFMIKMRSILLVMR